MQNKPSYPELIDALRNLVLSKAGLARSPEVRTAIDVLERAGALPASNFVGDDWWEPSVAAPVGRKG